MRKEFDFLEPSEQQKAKMLEKIKAHEKSGKVVDMRWLWSVPAALAAVLLIAFAPNIIGTIRGMSTSGGIEITLEDRAAGMPESETSSDMVAEAAVMEAGADERLMIADENNCVYYMAMAEDISRYNLQSAYADEETVGGIIGSVSFSNVEYLLGTDIYEFIGESELVVIKDGGENIIMCPEKEDSLVTTTFTITDVPDDTETSAVQDSVIDLTLDNGWNYQINTESINYTRITELDTDYTPVIGTIVSSSDENLIGKQAYGYLAADFDKFAIIDYYGSYISLEYVWTERNSGAIVTTAYNSNTP